MHPAYFETRFLVDSLPHAWPDSFVILSAWATTGESWPRERNEAADRKLAGVIEAGFQWRWRITGYSPSTRHAEPSWAFAMPWREACELGVRFKQDALYVVDGDHLAVTHCDERRELITVGAFRERIDFRPVSEPC